MVTSHTKNCPICKNIQTYSCKNALILAIKKNSKCKSCCSIGIPKTKEHCKNISTAKTGISRSDEVKQKISIATRGEKNPMYECGYKIRGEKNGMYNKTHSNIVKQKLRILRIDSIKNRSGQSIPNYNISSIPILEQKATELGITDLQHAENGGEFYIKELGYWVDGYSKEKNIVIEYYENAHKNKIKKDLQRQNEIINLLKCEFIIIKEYE
jgi:hypothetical protein